MARTIARDHDQKRQHILKTSARVFAEEGFARASMAQVARTCGISKANIYHYYTSKDALLFDILDTYLSELRDRLCAPDRTKLPPAEQLEAFALDALLAYDGMDAEHKIQSEGLTLLPPDQQAVLKSYQKEMVATLSGILKAVAPQALDKDPARLRATTMSVFGMLNWYYMWNPGAGHDARKTYAELVAQLSINGARGLEDALPLE